MDLRSQFPVLERLAYLNAGSVGPVPTAAVEAAEDELREALQNGRAAKAQVERSLDMADRLRAQVSQLMGCRPAELALTGSTTDGVNAVIGGLDLGPGDEILTSREEHPGLLAPLGLARRRRGVQVRSVPFDEIAPEVGPRTRLVACSHVSWHSGRVVDSEGLAGCGVPVLLDGAQGLGAVPVSVSELGCDFYAASGQKWLCGPIGSGYLYVREARIADLSPSAAGWGTVSDPQRALDLPLREGAARFDVGFPAPQDAAWALAALGVLRQAGIEAVHERARRLAEMLAERLAERGLQVAPRGPSTLVSWESPDNEAESAALLEEGILVRHLPGTPYVRASVGAWSSQEELERLAERAGVSSSRS